jgi:serine/threonine protein kinase/Tfp pilus assembly protein PilF
MPLSPGDRLGPYEILAAIGAGGMGEVYRARDTRLGRDVAIKVSREKFSDRFEREARAVAALNHPNICTLYDVGPNYLVMEYIEGAPLSGPFAVKKALEYAGQIASALGAAHAKGITHRDLKPGNILVAASGIKLLDFGLALWSCGPRSADETATIGMTQAGTIMGTAAYMSPEQVEAKPVDARSDIFSFGVLLYGMLSGRCAFTGDSSIAIMAAIVRDEPEPLEATPALRSIVTRCLRKSPADRFQSMALVKDALLAAASGVSSAQRTPSIAVLPFANMGADKENEYFSDGLAEEILNLLAKIKGLKTIARTSSFAFRGKEQDITKIAETLRVATILEGSVRRAGSRVRVTAQLVDAADGSHLWSERYDRELADVFAVQDEIAQAIASALQVKLSGTSAPYKPSLPAYEALLKARYYFETLRPDLLPRVKECFEQAIALDPKFTLAYCEYGRYFWGMALAGALPANQAFSMMRSIAGRALELDPSLPDGHAMSGAVTACLDYDWIEAERRFRLAMACDPVPIYVRLFYSLYLLFIGRPADAFQQLELGLPEDPLNLFLRFNRAAYLAAAGRDEAAAEGLREVLECNPAMVVAQLALASLHVSRGEFDQAMALCKHACAAPAPPPNAIGLLAGLLERTGDTHRAEELLQKLQPVDAFGAPRGLATYHWVLGEFDAEADWLEKAIDQHDPYSLIYLRLWHGRELRSTPRWERLMRKLNLPES